MAVEFEGTERFEIRRQLGVGGMGVVYEAFDRERDALVALKTLKELDADSLLRFKQEFRAVQNVEHPNLVSLGELVAHQGTWFFTMELIEGVDFLSYVRPGGARPRRASTEPTLALLDGKRTVAFDEPRLRGALAELAGGIAALHRAGKIHRDIKPSNVKITPTGRAILLDFGLATPMDETLQSQPEFAVGTAAYMAPEQAARKPIGPAADWYSVGVMLYQALTGKLPFRGTSFEMMVDKQKRESSRPSDRALGVPEDLDEICAGLLRFAPDKRPSESEILRRLGADTAQVAASSHFSRPGMLVGRDRELARLSAAFDASESGAVTVVVHGESGIGKSALLEHFAELATVERGDVVTLVGRCYARESIPFKAVDGVVDALAEYLAERDHTDAAALLPRGAALLPRMFPVLGRVEAIAQAPRLRRPILDELELQRRTFVALRELFHRLTDHRRLILIIDDLQWADRDSLILLADLLRPPSPPPLLLLISARELGVLDSLTDSTISSGALQGRVEHLELQALEPDMAMTLAKKTLSRAGMSGQLDPEAIATEAQGHPLYIDELVRHAALSDVPEPTAPRIETVVWSRIQVLPDPARRLLELVCVADAPMTGEALGIAARMNKEELDRNLSLLRAADLVRGVGLRRRGAVEPYHDRVRQAVLGHLAPDDRVNQHARLSIGLESTNARPELLLAHLEAAGETEKAAMYAERAARRATSVLAFDRAVDFYQAALRLGRHHPDKRRALNIELSDALANTGRGAESAEAALEGAEGADRTTQLECRRRAAEQLLICGHIEPGLEALRSVLDEVKIRMPANPRGALLSVAWHRMMLRLGRLRWKEKHENEIAASDLLRVDVHMVASHGLSMVDNVRGADFQARGLRLALQVGEPRRVARCMGMEAVYLGSQGGKNLARAHNLMKTVRSIADREGDPELRGWNLTVSGILSYFGTDFRQAAAEMSQAIDVFREETTGRTWELNNSRMFHMFALRHLGAFSRIGELYEVYLRDAVRRGDLYIETSLRFYANSIFLARDDLAGAEENRKRARWVPLGGRFHLQHWYELEALGESALYRGEERIALEQLRGRFESLTSSLLTRIQVVRCLSVFLKARLLIGAAASTADDAGHLGAARQLARKLGREDAGYARVWTAMLEAGIAHQDGDEGRAIAALGRAAELAGSFNMRFYEAAARYRLGQLLGGDEGSVHRVVAEEWLDGQGIRAPDKMVRIAAPGSG